MQLLALADVFTYTERLHEECTLLNPLLVMVSTCS